MDAIESVKYDHAYKKYKLSVKTWEKDFKSKFNRIPSKFDIKEAPTNVRYAYKKYFQLKSAALENALDICGVDDSMLNSPESSFITEEPIENDNPKGIDFIEQLPTGLELNKLLSTKPVDENNVLVKVSPIHNNLSKKLFQNSKFTLRNPRKSLKLRISHGNFESENKSQIDVTLENSHNDSMETSYSQLNVTKNDNQSTGFENISEQSFSCSSFSLPEISINSNTDDISSFGTFKSTTINKCNNTNTLRQINEGWLERVTGLTSEENGGTKPTDKFGMKNININFDIDTYKTSKPEDIICDYVDNSESDNERSTNKKFQPALKKRKLSRKHSSYDLDVSNTSESCSVPSVTKSTSINEKSKRAKKTRKDLNDDIPPAVEEYIPFEIEKDLLPRQTSKLHNSDSSMSTIITNRKGSTPADKLEQKIKNGTLNDNFVKINIEKKVFVRGKKSMNYTKYKKQQWKNKKALHGGMEFPESGKILCFKCGNAGHMSRYCTAHRGDSLLPLSATLHEDIPSLEEMALQTKSTNNDHQVDDIDSNLVLSTYEASIVPASFLNLIHDNEQNMDNMLLQPIYTDIDNVDDTELHKTLEMFGHTSFRPGQEESVKRILCGKSTLLLLSTGGGKSLCYQLPAYIYSQHYKCITLVISPLVSLMEDQVLSMPEFLKAGCLHTNQSPTQRQKIVQLLKDGELSILLISPEALIAGDGSKGFKGVFKSLPPIAFACIDEAHCVSQWSHNFRPSYLMICRVLREKLKVNTILGLTATASQATIKSVIHHINIPDGLTGVISNPDLPANLILSVSQERDKDRALICLLSSDPIYSYNSIIVYCIRRDECERIAGLLRSSLQEPNKPIMEKRGKKRKQMSFVAEAYHAGMSAAQRKRIQSNFMNGALRIIVATVAFGMGINKSDIRCIIHYDMPRNFESYVQEVGRAGRDGNEANCHVFVNNDNKDKNELLKHIYSNSIDRPVIRKLLQKVFLPCNCAKGNPEHGRRCMGHEVSIPIDETVEELDLAEENISTLLCYLELHPEKTIKVLHNTYTMCKIFCYGGADKLKQAAATCPPLAMALQMKANKQLIKNDANNKSNDLLEFPVVEIAAELGWESGLTKYNLKNLEWTLENGMSRRSPFKVEFHTLGFRIRTPGDLEPLELDKMLDYLHEMVMTQEKAMLYQLEEINVTLHNIGATSFQSMSSMKNKEYFLQQSAKLKNTITHYFQREGNVNREIVLEARPLHEERIICDIRALINAYRDCNFTGRSIARIFQGINSPNYPAIVWGRCKFWRSYMNEDFYGLVRLATQQIMELKRN